jgi:nicotinate-nucleotide pyrophosphorylase (carboxylating)
LFYRFEENPVSVLPDSLPIIVESALEEDIGDGDITAYLVPEESHSRATVICREKAVIAGVAWFDEVFSQLDPDIEIQWNVSDGDLVEADTIICTLQGDARSLLTGERTALNFIQTLSGTATCVHEYVQHVADTGVTILDTRKTLPGLRDAQKYAVTCGGGQNHRHGLYDGILIKENHIMASGSIAAAVATARELGAAVPVEVEVESLDELRQALEAGADIVLLDNMANDVLREAVAINDGQAKLEASGGVNLQTIRGIAETGVDYISIGGLTKDLKSIDLSMRFRPSFTLHSV